MRLSQLLVSILAAFHIGVDASATRNRLPYSVLGLPPMNTSTPPTPLPRDALGLAAAAPSAVLTLYGSAVLDLQPRGDLVLERVEGTGVTFALVRAYRREGRFAVLPQPMFVSVLEPGHTAPAGDIEAEPGERVWEVPATRAVHSLELVHAPLAVVLGLLGRPGP